MYHKMQGLLTSLPPGLKHVKTLRVQNQWADPPLEPYEHSSSILIEDFPEEDEQTGGNAKSYRIKMLNSAVRSVIQKIPKERLQSFVWYHQLPITSLTHSTVLAMHHHTLRDFRISSLHHTITRTKPPFSLKIPRNLERLEVLNLTQYHTMLGKLTKRNGGSLAQITIGNTDWLADALNRPNTLSWQPSSDSLKRVFRPHQAATQSTTGPSKPAVPIQPKSLKICSLDISTFVHPDGGKYVDWSRLQCLSLESCQGSGTFLEDLTSLISNPDAQCSAPKLTEFRFRSEQFTYDVIGPALEDFLKSFSGLRCLSILIDNSHDFISFEDVVETHGETLEILVLDTRNHKRSGPFSDCGHGYVDKLDGNENEVAFEDISLHCPNLRELGIALAWGDGSIRKLLKNLAGAGYHANLPNLRTLHIRNASKLPAALESDRREDLTETERHEDNLQLNAHHVRFAEHFAQSMLDEWGTPKLNLIAFGPMVYHHRWHIHPEDTKPRLAEPPLENRTSFFGVNYVHVPQLWEKAIAVVKPIGDGSVESLRDYTEHLSCFNSYWMR